MKGKNLLDCLKIVSKKPKTISVKDSKTKPPKPKCPGSSHSLRTLHALPAAPPLLMLPHGLQWLQQSNLSLLHSQIDRHSETAYHTLSCGSRELCPSYMQNTLTPFEGFQKASAQNPESHFLYQVQLWMRLPCSLSISWILFHLISPCEIEEASYPPSHIVNRKRWDSPRSALTDILV